MQLKALADLIAAELMGDGEVQIGNVSSIESSSRGDLVFVEDVERLALALGSECSAIIAGSFAKIQKHSKPLLVVEHAKLAFALAAKCLQQQRIGAGWQQSQSDQLPLIHRSVVIHPSARLHESVMVGANSVIGPSVAIAQGTSVAGGCVISADAEIGRDCMLHANVTIYPRVRLGDRVIVHAGAVLGSDGFGYVRDESNGRYEKFPQIGKLEIEDDVEIGANSTIDRGALDTTLIGRGTKIDNLVHIGHNCRIGKNVIIAAQTGLSGSVTIDDNTVIGGQVGIGEHARIEEGVLLGGQAGVLPGKILRGKGIAFWGTPARPVREYLKQLASLERIAKER
jgi:UDP-3-O-[3-hydroxymyristoyl] glucosamine N-acyltransferase